MSSVDFEKLAREIAGDWFDGVRVPGDTRRLHHYTRVELAALIHHHLRAAFPEAEDEPDYRGMLRDELSAQRSWAHARLEYADEMLRQLDSLQPAPSARQVSCRYCGALCYQDATGIPECGECAGAEGESDD